MNAGNVSRAQPWSPFPCWAPWFGCINPGTAGWGGEDALGAEHCISTAPRVSGGQPARQPWLAEQLCTHTLPLQHCVVINPRKNH